MSENQNPKKIQELIQEKYQASNLGVNKIILNINGGNSNFPTNKNSEIEYSLEQPLKLDEGDSVTLLQAFVEEKGLQSNTISFEKDISAQMRFMYYKQADCGDQTTDFKDVEFVKYPKFFPDFYNNLQGGRPADASADELALPNSLVKGNWIESLDTLSSHYGPIAPVFGGVYPMSVMKGDCNLNMSSNGAEYLGGAGVNNISSGSNGQPQYLMEEVKYKDSYVNMPPFYRPVYGSKTITIKAGNYSLDAISDIISSQLNGSIGINNNLQSNAMLDKMYIPTASANGESFLQNTCPFFNNIDINFSSKNDVSIIGTNNEDTGYERRIEGLVRELNYGTRNFYENFEFTKLGVVGYSGDGLQQRENEATVFPNGSATNPQGNSPGNTNIREGVQGNIIGINQSNNFYINRSHLYQLFERDNHFYDTPDQFTKPTDNTSYINFYAEGGNRPPTMRELFNIRVSSVSGVIPFSAKVPGPLTPPNANRIAKLPDMDIFSSFFPVITVKDTDTESQPQKFAGTSVAELVYDSSVSDRFSFKNFHEFYKLPSLTADATKTSDYGGQQATKYNNPYSQTTTQISYSLPLDIQIESDGKAFTNAVYPIDSSSGVCINNFDFDLVKTTKVYIDLVASIKAVDISTLNGNWKKERLIYELFTKPFDKFFATVDDAKEAWSNSLWSRLGFDYNQLGDISSNLEKISTAGGAYNHETNEFDKITPSQFDGDYYNRMILPQKGLITHNQFDFTQIVSSNGLGDGNPVALGVGTPLQTYTLQSYYLGSELKQDGIAPNTIHLLETSKKLEAKSLPSLSNNKSYLVIESDIVNINYKDSKASWGNILGIMSKENSTNDTLFGSTSIDFIVTQPKVLTGVKIIIKNPDGTLVNDDVIGKNNAFIIQISKAIKPAILPLTSI